MTLSIEDLPDYPSILEVARALWRTGDTRGAAVMVGAGFSRFADLPAGNAPLPPLWHHFATRMATALRAGSAEDATTDALRLAEEYRSEFGQSGLEGLVRELVLDGQWRPGTLHDRLVNLPWADILTTNWDTLLERAASGNPELEYDPVLTESDIARTRSPRIVKLHGTFPSLQPFILAEEDFRTYPAKHAPFVNLAQQALLENDLCLLGFSGDDPNFLSWSGWIRDHLGSGARRIRLVGVLALSGSQRRMLENRNVSVIDLAPLVEELDPADRWSGAYSAFLKALEDARPPRPWTWSHYDPPADQKPTLPEVVAGWRAEREEYPGWLLAPHVERHFVRRGTDNFVPFVAEALVTADHCLRRDALLELAWRSDVGLWNFPAKMIEYARAMVTDSSVQITRTDRLAIGLSVARHHRRRRDWEEFEAVLTAIAVERPGSEDNAQLSYERALRARDELNHAALEKLQDMVAGDDPIWKARRAALLGHLGRDKEAVALLREGLADVRARRARDRRSLWLLSREAWIRFALRLAWMSFEDHDPTEFRGEWPGRYAEARCDPWDELQAWDADLEEAKQRLEKRQVSQEIMYDPGYSRVYDHTGAWTASYILEPHDELLAMIEQVGLARLPHQGTVVDRLERAAKLLPRDEAVASWKSLLAVHDREGGIMNARFDRMSIARMPAPLVLDMVEKLKTSIDFGRVRLWEKKRIEEEHQRQTPWVEKVRRHVELLSRLAVRLNPEEAERLLEWSLQLAGDPEWRHWWLFEGTSNLIERALSAIPPVRRASFAGAMLDLPLSQEKNSFGIEQSWPELAEPLRPFGSLIERPNTVWDHRIGTLISYVRTAAQGTRSSSLHRLLVLNIAGQLYEAEQVSLAEAIWCRTADGDGLPKDVELLPHAFLQLPEPEPGRAARAFRKEVVGRLLNGQAAEGDWRSLGSVCALQNCFALEAPEALELLDVVLTQFSAEHIRSGSNDQGATVGFALRQAVLPALTADQIGADRSQTLLSAASKRAGLLVALPTLGAVDPMTWNAAQQLIRRGMRARDATSAAYALHATGRWSDIAAATGAELLRELSTDVAYLCGTRRGQSLRPALETAAKLVANGHASEPDVALLEDALDMFTVESAYDNEYEEAVPALTRSLVRRDCVRLAAELSKNRKTEATDRWLRCAPDDPLPEVRFALNVEGKDA